MVGTLALLKDESVGLLFLGSRPAIVVFARKATQRNETPMNEITATPSTPSFFDSEDLFGIVIPKFSTEVAAGFRQDTVAPTTNATQAQESNR